MQTNSNDEPSVPTEKANPEREIHIVMMPVKEIGATHKFIVKTQKYTWINSRARMEHALGYIGRECLFRVATISYAPIHKT